MKDIRKELEEERRKKKYMPFLTSVICFVAMAYGSFIVFIDGYLIGFVEPYLHEAPVHFVGWLLIIMSVSQFVGIALECHKIRLVSISVLFGLWIGLAVLSLQFHMGTGFPDHNFIWQTGMAVLTWKVCRRGEFHA